MIICRELIADKTSLKAISIMGKLSIFLLLLLVSTYRAMLMGYDCSITEGRSKAINALHINDCNYDNVEQLTVSNKVGQVIQTKLMNNIMLYTCKIIIMTKIYYCGILSYNYAVKDGIHTELLEINRDACIKLIQNGTLELKGKTISNIPKNVLYYETLVTEGEIKSDGTCYGVTIRRNGNTYSSAIETIKVEIFVDSRNTIYDVESNSLILSDMEECVLDKDFCISLNLGMVFWDITPSTGCEANAVDVLYEGNMTQVYKPNESNISSLISINDSKFILNLKTTRIINFCAFKAYYTDHNRILVIFSDPDLEFPFKKSTEILPANMDINLYHNSKLLFVKQNLERNLRDLYVELSMRECELRKAVISERIRNLRRYRVFHRNVLTNEPGWVSHSGGDVIFISRCTLVSLEIRDSDLCSINLPVSYKGKPVYLDTYDGVISEVSAECPCTTMMPTTFFIGGRWVTKTPTILPAPTPEQISPEIRGFNFSFINDLLTKGIYSEENLRNFSRFITHNSHTRKTIEGIVKKFGPMSTVDSSNFKDLVNLLSNNLLLSGKNFHSGSIWLYIGSYMGLILGFIYIGHLIFLGFRAYVNSRLLFDKTSLANWIRSLDPLTTIYKLLNVRNPTENMDINPEHMEMSSAMGTQTNENN